MEFNGSYWKLMGERKVDPQIVWKALKQDKNALNKTFNEYRQTNADMVEVGDKVGKKSLTLRSIKLQAVSLSVFRFSSETSMLTPSRTRPHCIRNPISPGTFRIGGSIMSDYACVSPKLSVCVSD